MKIPNKTIAFQVCFRGFNQFKSGRRKAEPSVFSKGRRNTAKRPMCVFSRTYTEAKSSMTSSKGVFRKGIMAIPHPQTETKKSAAPVKAVNTKVRQTFAFNCLDIFFSLSFFSFAHLLFDIAFPR